MPLRYRLMRALVMSVAAGAPGIAAAQSPESWALCTSRDVRLRDQAVEACSAIIAASGPDSEAAATAHGYRATALLRRSSASREQDREQAGRDFEKAAGSGLGTAIVHVFRGQLHLFRRNPDAALTEVDEAIRRDPQLVLAHAVRGAALRAKGDNAGAVTAYNEAIRLDPAYGIAFFTRARAYIELADLPRAAADLDQVLRLDSTSHLAAEALAYRAGVQSRLANPAGAIVDADAALALNVRNDPAHRSFALSTRARAYVVRGEWSRAVADLDEVLQLDSTSPAAAVPLTTRATARYQLSDFAGAIADAEAVLKLDPRNEQALRIRSFAHAALGTASSSDGPKSMPDALLVYVARGVPGACGEKCEEWLAVEGTVDWEGPRRVIAALDRLGARKLPVVLNFRGRSGFTPAMSIGKILRERGFDATVGQTLVEECPDPLAAECMALKRSGKPLQASLVPSPDCNIPCVLGLAGGVRRTLPDATAVVIGGTFMPNRIGLEAVTPFREGRQARSRDLIKVHVTQMGVDPRVADMIEEQSGAARATELSREEIVRLRIVTAR